MLILQIIRSLKRDGLNTLIMIVSLAIGIACVNLIVIFLNREVGTDSFHEYSNQIYALKCDDPWLPGKKIYYCKAGSAEYISKNIPLVEDYCRVNNSGGFKVIANEEEYTELPLILGASDNFFNFFSYRLVSGEKNSVLGSGESIVISTELASKYFGAEDPVGKVITLKSNLKSENMVVSGIFEKPVKNSQLNFDMVRSIDNVDSRCYLRLESTAKREDIEKLLFQNKDLIPVINVGTAVPYYLEPLQNAYFDSLRNLSFEMNRDKRDLWIALIIGSMIILIAIFNFLGILANKFQVKVKEYYLRRIHGSSMNQLSGRLMTESVLIIVVSAIAGMLLTLDGIPMFNSLTNSKIENSFVFSPGQISIFLLVVIFICMVTLIFGIFLIRFNLNITLLKTGLKHKMRTIQIPAFNIFQISSSIALIICTFVIMKQMNFILSKPIGLDRDVIEVKIPPKYQKNAGSFREELLRSPYIKGVSLTTASPLLEHFLVSLKYNSEGIEKQYSLSGFSGDENYLPVLGINIIEGSGFSEIISSNKDKCLVNKSFTLLFPDQDLIGKGIPGMEERIIVGVTEDFNYFSLKAKVEPAFISYNEQGGHLLVKPGSNAITETRDLIATVWGKMIPDYPVNIESVGERFEWYHRDNQNFKKLIFLCSVISLFLSMIGLFAVSYQRSRTRTVEIGIRKINGSKSGQILILINSDFAKWVLFSFMIAVPVSFLVMSKWLESYAYRTSIGWWIYAIAGLIVLIIVFFTVSWQSWRASTRNPVEALRYE